MPDKSDYSAEPPRRERAGDPFAAKGVDDRADAVVRRAVPALIRSAGTIWMVLGAVLLVHAVIDFIMARVYGPNRGWGGYGNLVLVAFLLWIGRQSIKGTAGDSLGNGIWSILFGSFFGGMGVIVLLTILDPVPGPPDEIDPVGVMALLDGPVFTLVGLGLILTGVLALMGRADYKAYRRAGERSVPINAP